MWVDIAPGLEPFTGPLERFRPDLQVPGDSVPESEKISLSLEVLPPEQDPFPIAPGEILPMEIKRRGQFLLFHIPGCRAEYDFVVRKGTVRVMPERLMVALDNLFRTLYSYFLADRGGFLLHSFGFVWDQSTYLLFGPSGSGKSTAADLFSGLPPQPGKGDVLSDDLVQVFPDPGGGYHASQTPLEERYPSLAGSWAVREVLSLHQDRYNDRIPVSPSIAMSRLFASVPFVSSDPEAAFQLLEHLDRFLQTCLASELHFRPEPEMYRCLLENQVPPGPVFHP